MTWVADLHRPRPWGWRPCSEAHLQERVAGIAGRGSGDLEVDAVRRPLLACQWW